MIFGNPEFLKNVLISRFAPNVAGVVGWVRLTYELVLYGAYIHKCHRGNHEIFNAEVTITTSFRWTLQDVETDMTRELGHALDLNHSILQASMMFANPYMPQQLYRPFGKGLSPRLGRDAQENGKRQRP